MVVDACPSPAALQFAAVFDGLPVQGASTQRVPAPAVDYAADRRVCSASRVESSRVEATAHWQAVAQKPEPTEVYFRVRLTLPLASRTIRPSAGAGAGGTDTSPVTVPDAAMQLSALMQQLLAAPAPRPRPDPPPLTA